MTKKEIALLSFKVLSVYAFVRALDRSYNIAYYLFRRDQLGDRARTSLGLEIIPSLLCALCGIVLWFAAPLLAGSIFKATPSEGEPTASSVAIQEIAFSIVGLFVLAMAFPDLVSTIAIIFYVLICPRHCIFNDLFNRPASGKNRSRFLVTPWFTGAR